MAFIVFQCWLHFMGTYRIERGLFSKCLNSVKANTVGQNTLMRGPESNCVAFTLELDIINCNRKKSKPGEMISTWGPNNRLHPWMESYFSSQMKTVYKILDLAHETGGNRTLLKSIFTEVMRRCINKTKYVKNVSFTHSLFLFTCFKRVTFMHNMTHMAWLCVYVCLCVCDRW